MNFKNVEITKKLINSMIEVLNTIQEKDYVELPHDVNFYDLYRWDLTDFIMYMIASDGSINIDEVEVYRYLTNYEEDTLSTLKENIENSNITSYDFQSKIPVTLKLLVNATNKIIRYNLGLTINPFLETFLLTFIYAGRDIMYSDGGTTYQERRNFEIYIKNLIAYIEEHSYASFEKPLHFLLNE